MREPLHPPPKSAPEVYMYTLHHRHYQHPSASAETPQTTPFHIDLFCISHHNRDLEWRPRTGFKFDFLRVFLKNPTPEGFIVLFSQEKLAGLFLLKKVLKFSHERLDTNLFPFPLKLVVEWRRLSRFPAKMTLAHARALLENLVLEVVLFLKLRSLLFKFLTTVPHQGALAFIRQRRKRKRHTKREFAMVQTSWHLFHLVVQY